MHRNASRNQIPTWINTATYQSKQPQDVSAKTKSDSISKPICEWKRSKKQFFSIPND